MGANRPEIQFDSHVCADNSWEGFDMRVDDERARPARPWRAAWIAVLAVAMAAGSAKTAWAWGRNGHRAAAKLAETRLTPEARAIIRDLLEPGESLADASTWADENARSIPGSGPWHYVNVPITAARYSARDCLGGVCVVSKIVEFRKILADPNAPKARRRMALRYVVHLVQDLHQPLHVGDRRDRGGNGLQVQFPRNQNTNLHSVWDSGLFREAYRNERELSAAVLDLARRPEAQAWLGGSVEDWANESLEAARQAYAIPGSRNQLQPGARLGREYLDANLPLAMERLAKAGLRLSDVLNHDLKAR